MTLCLAFGRGFKSHRLHHFKIGYPTVLYYFVMIEDCISSVKNTWENEGFFIKRVRDLLELYRY